MDYKCCNCGRPLRTYNEELETLLVILLDETCDNIEDDEEVNDTLILARRLLDTEYAGWCGECAAKAYIN